MSVADRVRRRLRPVRGSQPVGAAIAVVAAVLAGRVAVGTGGTLLALVAGAALAAVVYAVGSDSTAVRTLAAVALVPAGGLVAASLEPVARALEAGFATAAGAYVAVAAVGTVGFTAALAGSRAPGQGRVKRAVTGGLGVLAGPFVLLLAVTLPDAGATRALLSVAGAVADVVVGHALGRPPTLGFVVFPVLVALAAFALKGTLAALPLEVLAADSRRASVAEALARVDRALKLVVVAGGVGVLALMFLALLAAEPTTRGVVRPYGPLAPVLSGLLTATALRLPLVAVLVGSVLVRVSYRVARRAYRTSFERVVQRAAPPAAAAAVTGVGAWYLVDRGVLPGLAEPLGLAGLAADAPFPTAVLVLLLAGALAVWTLLDVVVAGVFLPERATGPALAGAATFALAVLATLLGYLLVGFLAAGAALVAWEAGAYGRGLRTELSGRTARAELVHLGGTAGVAFGGVLVAVVLGMLLGGALVAPTTGTLAALVLAVGGAFLLLVAA